MTIHVDFKRKQVKAQPHRAKPRETEAWYGWKREAQVLSGTDQGPSVTIQRGKRRVSRD